MNAEYPVAIPAEIVTPLLSGARERGLDLPALFAELGIGRDLLEHEGGSFDATQLASLMRAIAHRLNDEGLGLFSRRLKLGSFALMARAALDGTTLVEGMDRFCRTFRLLQDDIASLVVDDGAHCRITLRFDSPAAAARRVLHEFILRVHWRFASWLNGAHLRAERTEFAFPDPGHAQHFRSIFPSRLVFDAPQTAICFDSRLLQAPLRRDRASLHAYLENAALDVVVPTILTSSGDRVRAWIHQEHARSGHWSDLGETAAALHCSASSLQRHLAQDGTSFQAIRDRLRKDWAIYLMQTSRKSVLAIAQELDFADSAGFQRAFKRWTGGTPGTLRGRLPGR